MSRDKDGSESSRTRWRTELTRRQLMEYALRTSGGLALAATAGPILAACGSSSSPSAGSSANAAGVAEAKTLLDKWSAPQTTFTAPGPSFDATKAKGKTAWIGINLSIPFSQLNIQGFKEGLGHAGVNVIAFDTQNQASQMSRGIEQATGQKVNVIVDNALPGALFKSDIAAAKAAGIPVLVSENGDPGPVGSDEPDGVVGELNQNHKEAGQIMADFTIADSNGTANALVIWSADVQSLGQPQLDGITGEFSRLAPSAKVTVKSVPSNQWQAQLATLTQASLASDPNINYVLPFYDGMVLLMMPGIQAVNAQNRIKIVTYNSTPAVMQMMAQKNVVAADCGTDPVRFGWTWADQVLRVLTGTPPVQDIQLPTRLFTTSSVQSFDLGGPLQSSWWGPVDYRTEYLKLWGLS